MNPQEPQGRTGARAVRLEIATPPPGPGDQHARAGPRAARRASATTSLSASLAGLASSLWGNGADSARSSAASAAGLGLDANACFATSASSPATTPRSASVLVELGPGWILRPDRSRDLAIPPGNVFVSSLYPSDIHFALGAVSWGGLWGRPAHERPRSALRQAVLDRVARMYGEDDDEPAADDDEDQYYKNHSNAAGTPANESERTKQVSRYFSEVLPSSTSMSAVRFLGWVLGKLWRMTFSRVDVAGIVFLRSAARIAKPGSGVGLVVLPTHRSHIDYLLLSYLFFGSDVPVPRIAAGENLNVPIIGPLLSHSGAFFIKRSFKGNLLYRDVLRAALVEMLRDGSPVEFFIEGGRTRTGRVGAPKLGLLSMVVDAVARGDLEDVLLLPVDISYSRAIEQEEYARYQLGKPKKPESLWSILRSGLSLMFDTIRGRGRYGSVRIAFTQPMSVRTILDSARLHVRPGESGTALAGRLVVERQRGAAVINGCSLVAASLLSWPLDASTEPTEALIFERARMLVALLGALGHGHRVPDSVWGLIDRNQLVEEALCVLSHGVVKKLHTATARLQLWNSVGDLISVLVPTCALSSARGDTGAALRLVQGLKFAFPLASLDLADFAKAKLVLDSLSTGHDATHVRRVLTQLIEPYVLMWRGLVQLCVSAGTGSVIDVALATREQLGGYPESDSIELRRAALKQLVAEGVVSQEHGGIATVLDWARVMSW